MRETDILSALKEAVRVELNSRADEEIAKIIEDFLPKMERHKDDLVSALLNQVEYLVKRDDPNNEITFQINIRR